MGWAYFTSRPTDVQGTDVRYTTRSKARISSFAYVRELYERTATMVRREQWRERGPTAATRRRGYVRSLWRISQLVLRTRTRYGTQSSTLTLSAAPALAERKETSSCDVRVFLSNDSFNVPLRNKVMLDGPLLLTVWTIGDLRIHRVDFDQFFLLIWKEYYIYMQFFFIWIPFSFTMFLL